MHCLFDEMGLGVIATLFSDGVFIINPRHGDSGRSKVKYQFTSNITPINICNKKYI